MTESTLLREIHEQPEVLRRLIEEGTPELRRIAGALQGTFEYVVIAARGTSDNAARYAQYLLGARNALQVALATPSLFTLYDRPPSFAGALVIGISQSGQSPDIVSVVEEARRQGRPTLALTNTPASPLAELSEHCIELRAGEERAVAATKTYTASLLALALLAAFLEGRESDLEPLRRVPDLVTETLELAQPRMGRAERYRYMEHCAVVGRGYNYATAFEIALKVKELTGIVAEPYSSADFRHGPIGMVREGFPTLAVAPTGAVYDDVRELIARLDALGGELLVVSDRAELLERAHLPLPLPAGIPEWLTPMLAVLPGQLLGYHLARARGLDPDQPEGLQKVTETW